MDVTRLRQAHDDFLTVAAAGGFDPPPAGEWDADRILAHVARPATMSTAGQIERVRA